MRSRRAGWRAAQRVRASSSSAPTARASRSTAPRKHIYAQLVDPATGRTIGTVSTRSKAVPAGSRAPSNVEAAKRVGKAVAELAREKQIEQVVFNRNGFLYHGRVKAVADAAREAGLQF